MALISDTFVISTSNMKKYNLTDVQKKFLIYILYNGDTWLWQQYKGNIAIILNRGYYSKTQKSFLNEFIHDKEYHKMKLNI